VGALEMKGIPLAGQHIDWVQQVFIARPPAGSIHCGEFPRATLFDLQVPPSLNDLLKRLIGVAQWASLSDRSGTCLLIEGRLEDHAKDMQ